MIALVTPISMKQTSLITRIIFRWLVNSLGVWIAGRLIPDVSHSDNLGVIIAAGFVLSLVNTLLKPLVIVMSLPFIVFSLGLFMVIINGFMFYVAAGFVASLEVKSFGAAVLAGIIIGLVNYAVTTILEDGVTASQDKE